MRFLDVARSLARRRWVAATAAALAAAGVASGRVPLLDAPGWELGMVGAWLATALALPLGLAAWREEARRPEPSPGAAAAGALAALTVLLGVLLATSAIRAAAGPCRVLASAALFPLLAGPSAALGCAVAVVAAVAARGRAAGASLLHAAVVFGSLALTLRAVYVGPQAFALDPLLGWWPGPLYDEALRADACVVLAQVETLAWAVAIAGAAEALVRRARRTRPGAVAGPALLVLAAAGAAVGVRAAARAEGLAGDRATLRRALGGLRTGPICEVRFPAEKPAAWADEVLAECEFHAHDVAQALGLAGPPRVTVYVHRSADEKRRLVGAAATDYTKPWLREIHVGDAPLPLPTLRHELVHAVASAVAPGPLGVPARAGFLVSAGLVEGLAVALEVPRGEWTVHQWTRAMRDEGLLPDVVALVGASGFFGAAPARAYTAAGSFLAFLRERRGPAAVTALYRTGDFAASLGATDLAGGRPNLGIPDHLVGGQPLPSPDALQVLVAEWQRFLDGVAVPPGLAAAARQRFQRGSLFVRRCAREAALLEVDASRAAAGGRPAEACTLWRREAALSESPAPLIAAAEALARAGDLDAAGRALREAAAATPEADVAQARAVVAAEGDLAWRRGEPGAAAARWLAALASHPERAEERLLAVKFAAVLDPGLAEAARPFLLGEGDPGVALARLAASREPLAAYLVGRAAFSRGEPSAAVPWLAHAVGGQLPASVALEARFTLGEARCATVQDGSGEADLAALAQSGPGAGDRERAEADLRRCAFDRARWGRNGPGDGARSPRPAVTAP